MEEHKGVNARAVREVRVHEGCRLHCKRQEVRRDCVVFPAQRTRLRGAVAEEEGGERQGEKRNRLGPGSRPGKDPGGNRRQASSGGFARSFVLRGPLSSRGNLKSGDCKTPNNMGVQTTG